jgi:hypothetical protein
LWPIVSSTTYLLLLKWKPKRENDCRPPLHVVAAPQINLEAVRI